MKFKTGADWGLQLRVATADGAVGTELVEACEGWKNLTRRFILWQGMPYDRKNPMIVAVSIQLIRREGWKLKRVTLSGEVWADIEKFMGRNEFFGQVFAAKGFEKPLKDLALAIRGRIPEENWKERYEMASNLS